MPTAWRSWRHPPTRTVTDCTKYLQLWAVRAPADSVEHLHGHNGQGDIDDGDPTLARIATDEEEKPANMKWWMQSSDR
jgi:hypothetical protein